MLEGGLPQEVRFRSDLVPKLSSWLTVVFVYIVIIAILFVTGKFLTSLQKVEAEAARVSLAGRQVAAIERLVAELDGNSTIPAFSSSLASYGRLIDEESKLVSTGRQDAARLEESRARIERLGALAVARGRQSEMRNLLGRLADDEMSLFHDARLRLAEARNRTIYLAIILAGVVFLSVTGGGWMFLRRSRNLEALLEERTREIEEIDQSRRLFFAKASHELRTPITAMRGEAEVALADRDSDLDAMRDSLQNVIAYSSFLTHRIEEMIGLARTADGKLHLESDPLDLRDIVKDAVHDSSSYANSVEVTLRVSIPDTRVPITGDALWLRRALLAVIENALKFSPMEGTVRVTLVSSKLSAKIEIADEGPGVTPDELPLIFEAYYQTDAGRMRGGSGLGLALARWVVEQHGGTAGASNIGNLARYGCRVTLTLPFERVA